MITLLIAVVCVFLLLVVAKEVLSLLTISDRVQRILLLLLALLALLWLVERVNLVR